MAGFDFNTLNPRVVSSALNHDIDDRADPNLFPRHVVVGSLYKQGPGQNDVHVLFHTAGSQVVWAMDVRGVLFNKRLINNLSPQDALSIGSLHAYQRSQKFYND